MVMAPTSELLIPPRRQTTASIRRGSAPWFLPQLTWKRAQLEGPGRRPFGVERARTPTLLSGHGNDVVRCARAVVTGLAKERRHHRYRVAVFQELGRDALKPNTSSSFAGFEPGDLLDQPPVGGALNVVAIGDFFPRGLDPGVAQHARRPGGRRGAARRSRIGLCARRGRCGRCGGSA